MPVFGIVPYRTEARTRLETAVQEQVDFLLRILKTVNDVIRTSTGPILLDLWPNMIRPSLRPPPVFLAWGALWDNLRHTRSGRDWDRGFRRLRLGNLWGHDYYDSKRILSWPHQVR